VRRLRRTLVDLLQRDISQADNAGPDWPTVVEDAVLRQDMEWVEESLMLGGATQRPERQDAAAHDGRQHA